MIVQKRTNVTVAVIGYGYWGPNLVRNYQDLPDAQVKYVCDRDMDRAGKASRRYPSMKVVDDPMAVFNDPTVDAVVIATPISTHYPLAKKALDAGKHVFVEKPLASSSGEAELLVEAAERRGLTLMVGHTFVYSPPVERTRQIIESGELGDIYYVSSSRVNLGLHQRDASVIWDLAPHDLSILFYWLGESEPVSIHAFGRACVTPHIPDVAFMNLRFPSGVVAQVQLSWLSPIKLRRTTVIGNKKMLLYDDTESVEKVRIFDHGVDYQEPGSFGEFQLSYRTGDIVSPRLDSSEPLASEAAHFVECIASGQRPKTDGYSGLAVVRAIEQAEQSMMLNGTLEEDKVWALAGCNGRV